MRGIRFALPVLLVLAAARAGTTVESLPGPRVSPWSFELLSNSRFSVHSGIADSLPRQVLANVLWAMNRAPLLGESRDLYVATPDNVWRFDPGSMTLGLHRAGDRRYSSGAAFEVGVACARHEDAGFAIQAGLLAATAFREDGAAGCPMKWAADHANSRWDPDDEILMVNVFGRAAPEVLDSTLVAISSDTSLPAPHTFGPDTFELVLMDLAQDTVFSSFGISLETAAQLLWAAYGITPHRAWNGRRGLTVPSAVAGYFLTDRVYLVTDAGVECYHNRLPGNNLTTADHRLETVVVGDRRPELRFASNLVPSTAPAYVVVCCSDTTSYQHVQEAGFAGFQLLCQARALGLSGHLAGPLSPLERDAIGIALDLPLDHHPVLVFSVGEPATGAPEPDMPLPVEITRARPVIAPGEVLTVEYLLRRPGNVRAEVFDLLGRPVTKLFDERLPAGYHSFEWDGTDGQGRPVKRGSYVIGVFGPGSVAQHKVAVF